jgi:hypothetical protein
MSESFILSAMSYTSSNIAQLSGLLTELVRKVIQVCEHSGPSTRNDSIQPDMITPDALLHTLCPENFQHEFYISVTSEIPRPAYKDRSFSLSLCLMNTFGKQITLEKQTKFIIQIYTLDYPVTLLERNTVGDKMLRGTYEAYSDSVIMFKRVFVNEVSSHFRNGYFLFVVIAEDKRVKPLIIDEFVVKARKISETGNKRRKLLEH